MNQSETRTIFVAAPSVQTASLAEALLQSAELASTSIYGHSGAERSIDATTVDLLTNADGVLAVIAPSGISPNVAFEIGLAAGRRLPVVLLQLVGIEQPLTEVPGDLRGLHQIRWDPSKPPSRGLASRLHDLFTIETPSPTRTLQPRATSTSRTFADATERRVANALAKVAESVVTEGPGNTSGIPDLSAWVAEMPNWANPLLVEVRGRDITGRRHSEAMDQLRAYLTLGQMSLGLLVVPGIQEPEWHTEQGTAIAMLGIETLEQMSRQQILGVLARGRNLVAHAE